MPKSVEFSFFVRILRLLGVKPAAEVGEVSSPSAQDLLGVVQGYYKRRKRKKVKPVSDSMKPRLLAYQQCLELVLEYQVYQVREEKAVFTTVLALVSCVRFISVVAVSRVSTVS